MSQIFCPKCGKDVDKSYDGLCKSCFLDQITLFECPTVLQLKVCPTCGAFFNEGKWILGEPEKIILSVIEKELKINKEAKNIDISILPEFSEYIINVLVKIKSEIRGADALDEKEIEIRLKRESCLRCSRISSGYYESIIQLRAKDRIPTQKEMNHCEKIEYDSIDNIEKKDPLAFVSKIDMLKEGVDIYIGSKSAARQISKHIIQSLGGDIIESPKLVGKRGGKNIYRITYSVRLPRFVEGDILLLSNNIILIEHYGKKIKVLDLKTGLNHFYDIKFIEDATLICNKKDAKKTVICMEDKKEIQILDPDTYKPITISKPLFFNSKDGKDINVIKNSKGVFLIPSGKKRLNE